MYQNILSYLGGLGTTISNGVAQFASVIASNLSVGTSAKPSGITLYDEGTGEPYCVKVVGGAATTTSGACSTIQGSTLINPPYYTFDGKNMINNVVDSSGQGNTAYYIAGAGTNTATTTATGKIGQALNFDGVDDYVNVGTGPSSVQSIAFWLKASTSTTQSILTLNSSNTTSASSSALKANGLTSPTIYVDGVVVSTFNDVLWHQVVVTTGTTVNASALALGRIDTQNYCGCNLDEVRLYSRVLSAAEVLQLYRLGSTKSRR